MKWTQSIRFRLMGIIGALVVGTLLVVSGIGYYISAKYLDDSLNQTEQAIAASAAAHVGTEISTSIIQLEDLASIARLQSGDKTQIAPALKEARQRLNKFDDIVYASLDGATINGDNFSINVADREYFQKVVATKKPYVSEVFLSRANQKRSVALCVPVMRGNQLTGILFAAYSLDRLLPIIQDISYKQKGYGALLEDNGVYLAHPTRPELIGNMNLKTGEISDQLKSQLGAASSLDPKLLNAFKETTEKDTRVRLEYQATTGAVQIGSLNPIPLPGDQHWILLLTTTKADATSETTALSRVLLGLSALCLFIVLGLTYLLSKSFVRPILRINQIAQDIAAGHLRDLQKTIQDTSEFGQLSDNVLLMNKNLRTLVQQVQTQSDQLAASSEEMTASAHQSAEASNQVAASITEIAQGADIQATSASQIMQVAQTMSEQVEQISQAANDVSATATSTSQAAEQGRQVVEQTVAQMNEIGQNTTATQATITELNSSSQEIREMVTLISSIAGQTNLLALNAAIEAARAGEQGRGFAVVAEEVRKLAEESNQAARQIGELVEKNETNLNQVIATTQAGAAGIQTGISLVHNTGDTFQNIVGAVLQLSSQIRDISDAIHQIATGNQTLVKSIQNIDTASKQAAMEAQTVSAATEEQSASMQEIASSSQSLAMLAADLQAAVAKFHL